MPHYSPGLPLPLALASHPACRQSPTSSDSGTTAWSRRELMAGSGDKELEAGGAAAPAPAAAAAANGAIELPDETP